jgi:hypothetical protein
MNKADNRVKTYACRKATNSSRQSINNTKSIDTGAIASDLKMNIRLTRLRMIICPAVIFANKRTMRANGFANIPITSTGIMIGNNQRGTPGVA